MRTVCQIMFNTQTMGFNANQESYFLISIMHISKEAIALVYTKVICGGSSSRTITQREGGSFATAVDPSTSN